MKAAKAKNQNIYIQSNIPEWQRERREITIFTMRDGKAAKEGEEKIKLEVCVAGTPEQRTVTEQAAP